MASQLIIFITTHIGPLKRRRLPFIQRTPHVIYPILCPQGDRRRTSCRSQRRRDQMCHNTNTPTQGATFHKTADLFFTRAKKHFISPHLTLRLPGEPTHERLSCLCATELLILFPGKAFLISALCHSPLRLRQGGGEKKKPNLKGSG